ncbi:hypothetical protein SAMN04488093_109136 [Tropicibacter naphthalenivorans]|uniref:Uncharacterized protein n=2 Tax=Tropicibacter naphthalenivorans TaxID=441103 RepID=A0A0P1GI21_9RHOB|nr:hypothetical protein TRN7648_03454 [Tropicibacter naphthalenivorans]SMD00543.1 hypothetical protein SAMN04488093_109136 [Tropicibacter naphthalenivorans]
MVFFKSAVWIALATLVLAAFFAHPLSSETIDAGPLSPPERFQESFDAYPETSTRDIVGLMIGDFGDRFDRNYVILGNPSVEISPVKVLCMQVVTQDGRFTSANPYERSARKTTTGLKAHPVSQAHMEDLATYEGSAVAVRAILAADADCREDDSVFLARLGHSGSKDMLTVQVMARNLDASMTLALPDGDAPPARVACASAGTARLAFDRICQMEVPPAARGQVVALTVTLDDGMETKDTAFRAFIPDPSTTQ